MKKKTGDVAQNTIGNESEAHADEKSTVEEQLNDAIVENDQTVKLATDNKYEKL